jgi:signal transduction histidine kinase/CheY-like chemotaxis protein
MIEFFRQLLSTTFFMPHGMCFAWDPAVLWVSVVSDALIAAAYYAIPFLLFHFVRKRRDISFNAIFVAFGIFILACGTTHLLGAVTVWTPLYRLDAGVKAITAAASVSTVLMLIPMMPMLIKLPSPSELARINRDLEREVQERRAAEGEVRKMNVELEERVATRTRELSDSADSLRRANRELQQEMERRRLLEDQLIQSQKMEAVGRLAGGVAHDFNNLLTAILGYNELLRGQIIDDPAATEYALEVKRAADRAAALTNQLLAFSRRQPAVLLVVDLNDIVLKTENLLRRIIGEDIELEARLAPDLSRVRVDPAQLDQVIMNLAVNSRDAMPLGGKLIIETANVHLTEEYAGVHFDLQPGSYVMLAVSDTGTGMDAKTKSRLFEPFFTTKEQGKGTGLGLSIVYGIVKQNGGQILVYSEPDRGTVFKIYIPAVSAPAERVVPARVGPQEAVHGTILLVEDEEQVRRLARALLERQGYTVLEAGSAAEACSTLREHAGRIDLLLTDVVMPQMSGPELATEAKAVRPGIGVLYMSGYTDNGVVTQGILSEDAAFIQKPFTPSGLADRVRDAIKGAKPRPQ